jgi:acetoacetate decarboxylase
VSFPPAPWRLYGEVTLIPARVRVADARRVHVPDGVRLLSARGYTLGGVLLADYAGGTLAYRELIVFSAVGMLRGRPGFLVSHIYVDSPASVLGGREIWRLPKELAEFTYSRSAVEVRQGDATLLRARIRRRRGRIPLVLPAPALGDGALAVGRIRMRGVPALATLEVPEASPFAALGLAGTRPALAGDRMWLRMAAVRL